MSLSFLDCYIVPDNAKKKELSYCFSVAFEILFKFVHFLCSLIVEITFCEMRDRNKP